MTKAYKIKLSMNKIMKIYVKNNLLPRICVKSTLFYASDFLKYPIILRRFTKYSYICKDAVCYIYSSDSR